MRLQTLIVCLTLLAPYAGSDCTVQYLSCYDCPLPSPYGACPGTSTPQFGFEFGWYDYYSIHCQQGSEECGNSPAWPCHRVVMSVTGYCGDPGDQYTLHKSGCCQNQA
jgi:hypothetical protein